MRQFLEVLLHMGCVKMPSLKHYWSKNSLYRVPLFSRIMPRNKFQLMLRFWHFINNEDSGSGRLCKINGLLDHLNNTMDNIYCPNKNISIDESMMLWKGRLVFRQYVKNKSHKYGIKFYELCESDGIVLKLKIYSSETTLGKHLLGQTGAIVLDLMEKIPAKRYHLYTDNFYNSFELTKHMINQKTYICDTLRTDRKSNPKDYTKAKLKQGDVIIRSREGVVVAKWKDKRDVLMINNLHSLLMIELTNRRGEKKMKPNVIKDYN
ncbi:piggyBac transposable element-derived protein 4-like [Hydra vulgaris]|uniref:PiggyBac transposable element-derived protein 4-like n=1 Tax=Hydra vulgaris TaxID=6087 RepID=A0ABM4B9D4_HYDVU